MFKSLSLLLLSSTLLLAINPKPYASLGDAMYDTTTSYEKIVAVESTLQKEVETYLERLKKTKALGFEAEVDKAVSSEYLKALRQVDALRQKILVRLNAALYRAMDERDFKRFSALIQSDLLDLYKTSDDVLPFYKEHFKKGSIAKLDKMIAMENRLKKDALVSSRQNRVSAEERRISRMREASAQKDARLEAQLDAEVEKEKAEVNQMLRSEIVR